MMQAWITGIQQAGIGVKDADEAKYYYRTLFGMDALVFDDRAKASLMTKYTGNMVHDRRALLTMNMNGGGGFELWQYLSRMPTLRTHAPNLGDPGIYAIKIKVRDIHQYHAAISSIDGMQISPINRSTSGRQQCWITDAYHHIFEIVEHDEFFAHGKNPCAGICGAIICVRNMDKAIHFYQHALGMGTIVKDVTGAMKHGPDPLHIRHCRRVVLSKPRSETGAFSRLLGSVELELIQVLDHTHEPPHLFQNLYWGDGGFIHLCFDVLDMDALQQQMMAAGYAFTVDSATAFSMEQAAGRFCYVEDPDGTLIELVQTHQVPILKKWGWHLNLTKRKHQRPLADWMVKMIGWNKVK